MWSCRRSRRPREPTASGCRVSMRSRRRSRGRRRRKLRLSACARQLVGLPHLSGRELAHPVVCERVCRPAARLTCIGSICTLPVWLSPVHCVVQASPRSLRPCATAGGQLSCTTASMTYITACTRLLARCRGPGLGSKLLHRGGFQACPPSPGALEALLSSSFKWYLEHQQA